jgi:hypothetical protein
MPGTLAHSWDRIIIKRINRFVKRTIDGASGLVVKVEAAAKAAAQKEAPGHP